MESISSLPARKTINALEKLGFQQIRKKGSHLFMLHPDGRIAVIPRHQGEHIGRGIIRKIINDARITIEAWLELIEVI